MAQDPKVIDAWTVRHGEEMRVLLQGYRGKTYLHVRRFYQDEHGAWQPGKGATLAPEDLPRLRRAVLAAERAALEAGLIPEEAYELLDEPLPAVLLGEAGEEAA